MKSLFPLFFISLLSFSSVWAERKLDYSINPKCNETCNGRNATLVYLRAQGENDTLHYLWDFIGDPTILVAITSHKAELDVDWEAYFNNEPNSVNFTEPPKYTFGVIIQKIIEFDDVNDTAIFNMAQQSNVLHPRFFNWRRTSLISDVGNFIEMDIVGADYYDPDLNRRRSGSLKFLLKGFCKLDHADITPHLLHSENATQIEFIFDNLETNSTFGKSRFAIELVMVSESTPNVTMAIDSKKSLDDEHTPGIFEVVEVKPVRVKDNAQEAGGYLQWRPISYTTKDRDVSQSTETTYYPLVPIENRTGSVRNSLLYMYYGERINGLLVESVFVSLGAKGDGFYKKTSYLTWTFVIGYGVPPDEQFSSFVLMIICLGLGIPILILTAAGVVYLIRRKPKQQAYVQR